MVTNWNFIIIYKRFRKWKTFFAERNILCNKAVYLVKGLIFFNRIVTPVACFAAATGEFIKGILASQRSPLACLTKRIGRRLAQNSTCTKGSFDDVKV